MTCNFVNNFGEDKTRPSSRHVVHRGLYAFRIRNYTEVGTRKIVDISPREILEYPKPPNRQSRPIALESGAQNWVCILTARNGIIFHTTKKKTKNKKGGEKRKPDEKTTRAFAIIVRQKSNYENANSVASSGLKEGSW